MKIKKHEDKIYYYLQSIYLDSKNIIFEGSQKLKNSPKNMSSKMDIGEIYIDWYQSNGSLSSDRQLIHGRNNISYALCDYDFAKEAFKNGYDILVSYKPTNNSLTVNPFFYFINKKDFISGFDNALNYFKSIHHNEEFNFFLHKKDNYLFSLKYQEDKKIKNSV